MPPARRAAAEAVKAKRPRMAFMVPEGLTSLVGTPTSRSGSAGVIPKGPQCLFRFGVLS